MRDLPPLSFSPRQILFTTEELAELKRSKLAGIYLLGFQPREAVKDYQSLKCAAPTSPRSRPRLRLPILLRS